MTFEELLYICWCDYHGINIPEIAFSLGWSTGKKKTEYCAGIIEKAKKDGLYQEYVDKYETGNFVGSHRLIIREQRSEEELKEPEIKLIFDSEKLNQMIEEKGISNLELKEYLNFHLLRDVENLRKSKRPRSSTILKLAKLFDIPISELFKEVIE